MATLQQIYDLAYGAPTLRQRFQAARLKSAWFVLNESAATTNHVDRVAWAAAIVAGSDDRLDIEYRWALSNATLQNAGEAATDNDLDYVVAVFLDAWADDAAAVP